MQQAIDYFPWRHRQLGLVTDLNILNNSEIEEIAAHVTNMNLLIIFFFKCKVSKFVRSIVARIIGENCRPDSKEQYMTWLAHFLPHGKKFYFVGLAIWKL